MDEGYINQFFLEVEVHRVTPCSLQSATVCARHIAYRYASAPDFYVVYHALPSFSEASIKRILRHLNPMKPGEYL